MPQPLEGKRLHQSSRVSSMQYIQLQQTELQHATKYLNIAPGYKYQSLLSLLARWGPGFGVCALCKGALLHSFAEMKYISYALW